MAMVEKHIKNIKKILQLPTKEQDRYQSQVAILWKRNPDFREAYNKVFPENVLAGDCRLDSNKCTGFALSHEDQVLHLSVFARESGGKKTKPSSRMQRFSGRRRTRM